ncbi:Myc-type basic helix-loop-helix (bHLH) domain [Trinorchestia longiramus]|nr:Myc-type basic helix-loop-helix (bHLH) domain [Trinorchestia longiramus]
MDATLGGPLQEISINRIKGQRKILQKRENQINVRSPGTSSNQFIDASKCVVKANSDDVEAPQKENICASKSSLPELGFDIPGTRHVPTIEGNSSCTIQNYGVKAQKSISASVRPLSHSLNVEDKLFLKKFNKTTKTTTEFLVTSLLPQTSGVTQLPEGNEATVLSKQEKKDNDQPEITPCETKPENQIPHAISVDNLKVVVIREDVVPPNQQTQAIEIPSPTLPPIDGTVLIKTHNEIHTNLPALDTSADGPDEKTRQCSSYSGIKLASAELDSSFADNYLGPITDSDSSACETSLSSSPVSSASVTNLTLIPISASEGFSKLLDEQTLADNKPVSSGIAVTSSVFQSVSSPASCKISQRAPLSRRNARERNRVRLVSQGFAILRQHVPQAARRKKLSKVETLRCAVDYIKALSRMIEENRTTNNVVPSASNSSTLSNSFGNPNETSQTNSFQLDASQVKHERDEHRHPLHEELQRQHLQTMLPIDSSRLLNASTLSKHREQCLQIAPSRQHKDGTDFSPAPGVSSGNAMLSQRVFNLPLNEPDVLRCQFIEFPRNPDLTYVPVAMCASTPSVSSIQTMSQVTPPVKSTPPMSRLKMLATSSIVLSEGDASCTTTPKITTLVNPTSRVSSVATTLTNTASSINPPVDQISSNIISSLHNASPTVVSGLYPTSPTISSTMQLTSLTISPTMQLTSPTISCTSVRSDGMLPVDNYSSPIPEVSALMKHQEELFDGDETDDTELMDCLSWWQEAP